MNKFKLLSASILLTSILWAVNAQTVCKLSDNRTDVGSPYIKEYYTEFENKLVTSEKSASLSKPATFHHLIPLKNLVKLTNIALSSVYDGRIKPQSQAKMFATNFKSIIIDAGTEKHKEKDIIVDKDTIAVTTGFLEKIISGDVQLDPMSEIDCSSSNLGIRGDEFRDIRNQLMYNGFDGINGPENHTEDPGDQLDLYLIENLRPTDKEIYEKLNNLAKKSADNLSTDEVIEIRKSLIELMNKYHSVKFLSNEYEVDGGPYSKLHWEKFPVRDSKKYSWMLVD